MPKIDYTMMPAVELRNFCRTFSSAIKRSMDDPAFIKAFNERHSVGKEVETLSESCNLHSSGNGINSYFDKRIGNGSEGQQNGEPNGIGGYTADDQHRNADPVCS